MNKNINNEKFWFKDINVLYNTNNLTKFFPSEDMNLSEILNSLVRLSFYISVIFIILKKNINYIFITINMMIISYLIYFNLTENQKK